MKIIDIDKRLDLFIQGIGHEKSANVTTFENPSYDISNFDFDFVVLVFVLANKEITVQQFSEPTDPLN